MASSLFDQMGGERKLRAVVDDFIHRAMDDVLIGYFFTNSSHRHLAELEYQLAGEALGADVTYRGRSMRAVHASHRILPGHFARRQKLLADVLSAHEVPEAVRRAWLAHNESLRADIQTDIAEDRK